MRRNRPRSFSLVEVQVDPRRAVAIIEDDIASPSENNNVNSRTILDALGELGIPKQEKGQRSLRQIQIFKKTATRFHESGKLKLTIQITIYSFVLSQALFDLRKAMLFAYVITDSTDIGNYVSIVRLLTAIFLGLIFLKKTIINGCDYQNFINATNTSSFSSKSRPTWNMYVVTLVLTVTMSTCLYENLSNIPPNAGKRTDIEWYFHYRCNDITRAFTSSSWSKYQDETLFPSQEGSDAEILLGVVLSAARLFSSFAEHFAKDFVLLVTIKINEFTNILLENDTGSPEFITQFNELKLLSKFGNAAISGVYEISLLDNLLLLSEFYNRCLHPEVMRFEKVSLGVGVAKIILFSFMAEQISCKMENIADWIQDTGIRNNPSIQKELKLVLKDINRNALGIGRRTLYINKGFLVNYFGISFAYFLSVVETRTKEAN